MITDFISTGMTELWLQENAPEYLENWPQELTANMPPQMHEAIRGLQMSSPKMGATFTTQINIAKTAIHAWGLKEVAILGAGRPQPFSPKPEQVLYYTDNVPEVLDIAKAQGYNTLQVDAGNPEDLRKLQGAKSVIATGLLHFFPDEAVVGMFKALEATGVETFVFSQADPSADQEHFDCSAQFVRLFPRTKTDVENLVPQGWHLEKSLTLAEFAPLIEGIGAKLTDQPHRANVFMAVREA